MTASPEMTVERRLAESTDWLEQLAKFEGKARTFDETTVRHLKLQATLNREALASLPQQPAGAERAERREEIAKIIDEWAWRICTTNDQDTHPSVKTRERWATALHKADAILSLPREPGEAWRGIERERLHKALEEFIYDRDGLAAWLTDRRNQAYADGTYSHGWHDANSEALAFVREVAFKRSGEAMDAVLDAPSPPSEHAGQKE